MIADNLLPEFDHEMATTRTVLALVRDEDADWKPHTKSFSMGDLALHITNLPQWAGLTLTATEYDMNPPGGSDDPPRRFESSAALLDVFDANVKAAREVIANTSDDDFAVGWTLKNDGHDIFTQPRIGVMRGFIMNHIIHHRGQLTVYLRLRDIPLPMVYGPTADTKM
jgi:uncharacterized damage-inducible protein DinB